VVVSDFREGAGAQRPEWARALAALSLRHDVLAVEVSDPREAELPDAGQLTFVDPETGQRVEIDSASPQLRRAFASAELERRDVLRSHLRRAQARHVEVATDTDWLRELGRRDELKSHLRRARARHVEVATDADWLRALGRSLR
jgi:uncharacterized protein (DUF58 family)